MMYTAEIDGITLELETDDDVFSPSSADKGTLAMLSHVTLSNSDKLLDLGCGAGIVGIFAAKKYGCRVIMSDVSENAVALSEKNAKRNCAEVTVLKSDGFSEINEKDFTVILSNPPYHADFSVPKQFIEKGFNRLVVGGKMFMVTKRLDWYKNKLTSVFGGVKVSETDGYYVFEAEKRSANYASAAKKQKAPTPPNPDKKKFKRK